MPGSHELSKNFCWRYANLKGNWFKYIKTIQGSLMKLSVVRGTWKGHRNFRRTAEKRFYSLGDISTSMAKNSARLPHKQRQNLWGTCFPIWSRLCVEVTMFAFLRPSGCRERRSKGKEGAAVTAKNSAFTYCAGIMYTFCVLISKIKSLCKLLVLIIPLPPKSLSGTPHINMHHSIFHKI